MRNAGHLPHMGGVGLDFLWRLRHDTGCSIPRAGENFMRQIFVSLVVLLYAGTLGYAQDNSGLAGVYGPGQTAPGAPAVGGVYGPGQSASGVSGAIGGVYGPGQSAPAALPAPGASASVPEDSNTPPGALIFGAPFPGRALPIGVNPVPLPDRPGYGTAVVNGHTAIVERGTNRIIQLLN
jgi:hypothetical protein